MARPDKNACKITESEQRDLIALFQQIGLTVSHTTPPAFNAATRSAEYPSNAINTSSVCSPNVGGADRYSTGVRDNLIGLPTSGTDPAIGCGSSMRMPRERTCGSS